MKSASRTAGRSSLGGGTRGALSGLLPQPMMLKGQSTKSGVTASKSGECFCGRRCSRRCPQRMTHSGLHPTKGAGCGRAPALRSRPWNSSKSFLAEFLWASHLEWSTALTPVRSFSTSSWSRPFTDV